MKHFVLICLLLGSLSAAGRTDSLYFEAQSIKRYQTLNQQLASMLTCPRIDGQSVKGILVIQFQLTQEWQICKVEVFSQNELLKTQVIRELTGKKLIAPSSYYQEVFIVRVHFIP